MLMSLGQFVWGINTLAYQTLKRSNSYRWASSNRVGQRPARQYVGLGDDTINLSGWIAPELAGDRTSLDKLRAMASAGEPYVLVDALGGVYGLFVIESINETDSLFYQNGQPRKIEFELALTRVDDNRINEVAMITSAQDVFA